LSYTRFFLSPYSDIILKEKIFPQEDFDK